MILSVFFCGSVAAENFALGFTDLGFDDSVLDSEHFASVLIRRATTETLIGFKEGDSGGIPNFRLTLSDSFTTSSDKSKWSFRLRQGLHLTNGNPLSTSDILYSLERCRLHGMFSEIREVSSRVVGEYPLLPRTWVDLTLKDAAPDAAVIRPLVQSLQRCPVVEASSSTLFQGDLGKGTNLVGAGRYFISNFSTARGIELRRVYGDGEERKGAEMVEIRGFSEPKQALTALRTGSLDVMMTNSPDIITLSQSDTTLEMMPCNGETAVLRKGLAFSCRNDFSLLDMKYRS